MSKKETEPNKGDQGDMPVSDTSPDSFRKLLKYGTHPTPSSFPSLPSYVYNVRIFISTIFGIYLGYLGVTGSKGFTVGLGVTLTLPTMFLERWCKADNEAWEGKLSFQGFMPSVGMLVLMWVWVFNLRWGGEGGGEIVEMVKEKVGEVVEEVVESFDASDVVNDEF
ncbi:hypothetical protein TrVE_jg8524 [Triparma verrucosa]|uniref:Uncharacterized protein n=1 Tax=Triparma verrucosa TaxID=1606542 RepID=A0A9W7C6S9_9STRA|nr:hypothetical protein TrVE_jg8524 [Triparma verrucosa]